jgi:UTP-glucose-1-phosphate uridylyltransferase
MYQTKVEFTLKVPHTQFYQLSSVNLAFILSYIRESAVSQSEDVSINILREKPNSQMNYLRISGRYIISSKGFHNTKKANQRLIKHLHQ